jgi:superfamily I DNA/RNA helicase
MRAFEEALLRANIPYRLVDDVGFYARETSGKRGAPPRRLPY